MYIKPTKTYYVGTEVHIMRGDFLVMMQPNDFWNPDGSINKNRQKQIRCVIRKVAMHQFGPWMMGRVNLGGKWYTVSGSYGSDGLPMSVPQEIYERGVPLPDHLYEAWNKGGGHNGCGSEAPLMREWAKTIK